MIKAAAILVSGFLALIGTKLSSDNVAQSNSKKEYKQIDLDQLELAGSRAHDSWVCRHNDQNRTV